MSAPTFLKIAGARTIKDLKFVSKDGTAFTRSNCYLNFYDSIGNQLAVKADEFISKISGITAERFYDTGKVTIGYDTSKGHWYLFNDSNRKYPMDDYPINDGAGFLVKVASGHNGGVSVVYDGQVADEDVDVEVGIGVSKLSANVAPASITIKDIVLVSKDGTAFTRSNCYLNFYDSIGNQLAVKADEFISKISGITAERFYDTGKVTIGYDTSKGHWYLFNDSNRKYPMDDYPINAGAGFLVKVASGHNGGVTVKLPPALEKTDK